MFHVKHSTGRAATQPKDTTEALKSLAGAVEDLGWPFDESKGQKLLQWAQLVTEWRQSTQLTSLRDTADIITELMLPALYALQVVEFRDDSLVVDYGCGSGCTAAALSVVAGKGRWWLLDRSEKKLTFCRYAIERCGIPNMTAASPTEFRELRLRGDVVLLRAMPRRGHVTSEAAEVLHSDGIIVRWMPEGEAATIKGAVRCGQSHVWVAAIQPANVSRETLLG